jgi:capsular exopolysaccharide synthesis family protein
LEGSAQQRASADRREGALTPYLRALRAHRLLVVAITALTVLAAAAWLSVRSPLYEATAQVLLTPVSGDDQAYLGLQVLRESNDPPRTAQTAASLVDSARAAELAAAEMGAGWSRARIQSRVEIEPQGQSNIVAVTARNEDPVVAARLANRYVEGALEARREALRRQSRELLATLGTPTTEAERQRASALQTVANSGDPTMSIAERAIPPEKSEAAPAWLVLALALVAGFALASGAALLRQATDRRVRDVEELLEIYPLPVLARVPVVAKRGNGPTSLALPPAAREAYRTLQVQLDQDSVGPRVVMLTSASTGDGKTSAAVHLALALVAAGRRVILMDFDLRKPDVARRLGLEDNQGLVSLLSSSSDLSDVLVPAPRLPPLTVAPAGTGQGDVLLLSALARRLPEILDQARSMADYVILDTAPLGEVSDALRLVPFADEIVVVARPGNSMRPELELTRDYIERSGRTPIGMVLIGVTGTRASSYHSYGAPAPVKRKVPLGRSARR